MCMTHNDMFVCTGVPAMVMVPATLSLEPVPARTTPPRVMVAPLIYRYCIRYNYVYTCTRGLILCVHGPIASIACIPVITGLKSA